MRLGRAGGELASSELPSSERSSAEARPGQVPAAAVPHSPVPSPAVPSAVIELAAVTKVYPVEPPVVALRGVDLEVRQGDLVGVVGPSGSGKTTLLHLMGTLDRPTSGTVRVTGYDVANLTDRELSALRAGRVGFVFQQFFLAEHQTVLDNVADGLLYAGVALADRRLAAEEALARCGLADRLRVRPTQLSGGQRQRVAIARALVGHPAIVLADEPTGNLDQATGQSILDLFVELNAAGATIVVITHDLAVASRLHRVVRMLDGRITDDSASAGVGPVSGTGGVGPVSASDGPGPVSGTVLASGGAEPVSASGGAGPVSGGPGGSPTGPGVPGGAP